MNAASTMCPKELTTRDILVHPLVEEREDGDEAISEDEKVYRSLLPNGPSDILAEETYSVSAQQALKVFNNRWLPVPYFRLTTEQGAFDEGPLNWARVYVSAPGPQDSDDAKYRVVLAFDTEILERRPQKPYAAPETDDVTDPEIRFAWVKDIDRQLSYVGSSWQRGWIETDFREVRPLSRTAGFDETLSKEGESWAAYAVFLQCLQSIISFSDHQSCRCGEPRQRRQNRASRQPRSLGDAT